MLLFILNRSDVVVKVARVLVDKIVVVYAYKSCSLMCGNIFSFPSIFNRKGATCSDYYAEEPFTRQAMNDLRG